jgi:FKBP-type peptidyl-prolyl cis-trans isomerase
MASAFLITTVGVSASVIWQIVQEGKQKNSATPLDTTASDTNKTKLEGTMMQDFTPISKVDTLQVIDLEEGTGTAVTAADTVSVDYTGAVAATGTIFQSSLDTGKPVSFPLNGVIPGWTEGLVGMKEGGKRRLVIPTDKAYGDNPPSPSIPKGADLVFDITLHSIKK